jgi:hypothetical protein
MVSRSPLAQWAVRPRGSFGATKLGGGGIPALVVAATCAYRTVRRVALRANPRCRFRVGKSIAASVRDRWRR